MLLTLETNSSCLERLLLRPIRPSPATTPVARSAIAPKVPTLNGSSSGLIVRRDSWETNAVANCGATAEGMESNTTVSPEPRCSRHAGFTSVCNSPVRGSSRLFRNTGHTMQRRLTAASRRQFGGSGSAHRNSRHACFRNRQIVQRRRVAMN